MANVKGNRQRFRTTYIDPVWLLSPLIQQGVKVRQAKHSATPNTDQHRTLSHRDRELTRRIDRIVNLIKVSGRFKPHSRTYLVQMELALNHKDVLGKHHQLITGTFGDPDFRDTYDPPQLIERTFIRSITAIDPPNITHSTLRRGNSGFVGGFHTDSRYALRA